MSECSSSGCESESTERCCSSGKGGCPCGTPGCSGDPVECGVGMWTGSFFQALRAVQVEALKGKIQKAWGAKTDKAADAVLEAMGTKWQSKMAQGKADAELRQRLSALWQEK